MLACTCTQIYSCPTSFSVQLAACPALAATVWLHCLLFPRSDCLAYTLGCARLLRRSLDRLGGDDDIFEFVLGNNIDSVGICGTLDSNLQGTGVFPDAQIPITKLKMAMPVMVFLTRYGARARRRAGCARIFSS